MKCALPTGLLLMLAVAPMTSRASAPGLLAGIFVCRPNPGEVDMIHLLESPPGHLSGSLVVSAVDTNGARKADSVTDLTGSITGPNVSLRVENVSTLAGLFGYSANLLGSLDGEVLTLSVGADSEEFRATSRKRYEAIIADLGIYGSHVKSLRDANVAVGEADAEARSLNAELREYIAWGNQRIAHVAGVQAWYAKRIGAYRRCVTKIEPLAAARVPSWRWQACVLDIENDAYDRDNESDAIAANVQQNRRVTAEMPEKVASAQQQLSAAVTLLRVACPFSASPASCTTEVGAADRQLPWGGIDQALVGQFQTLAPKVAEALAEDTTTSEAGFKVLAALARRADQLYRSAY